MMLPYCLITCHCVQGIEATEIQYKLKGEGEGKGHFQCPEASSWETSWETSWEASWHASWHTIHPQCSGWAWQLEAWARGYTIHPYYTRTWKREAWQGTWGEWSCESFICPHCTEGTWQGEAWSGNTRRCGYRDPVIFGGVYHS